MNTNNYKVHLALSLFIITMMVMPASAQISEFQQFTLAAESSRTPVVDVAIETPDQFTSLDREIEEIKTLENLPTEALILSPVQWNEYADRLEAALESDHIGLNHAALRLVIAYGDHLKLDEEAVFDVMRIYRDDDSERARRMAVVTLAQMDSDWAISFLERSSRFEKSEIVRQTILAVLDVHRRDSRPL